MKFWAVGFYIFVLYSLISGIVAWGASGRVPPNLKVHFLFQNNANQHVNSQAAEKNKSETHSNTPVTSTISNKISQTFNPFHRNNRMSSYFLLGGIIAFIGLLVWTANFFRKKANEKT